MGGVKPLNPEKPHFTQGGDNQSGGGLPPPVRPPSPNQTFADGLAWRDYEDPMDPDPRGPPALNPADAILAEEVYPTADWPGHLPMPLLAAFCPSQLLSAMSLLVYSCLSLP